MALTKYVSFPPTILIPNSFFLSFRKTTVVSTNSWILLNAILVGEKSPLICSTSSHRQFSGQPLWSVLSNIDDCIDCTNGGESLFWFWAKQYWLLSGNNNISYLSLSSSSSSSSSSLSFSLCLSLKLILWSKLTKFSLSMILL